MKATKWLVLPVLLCLLLGACGGEEETLSVEEPLSMEEKLQNRCEEIVALYRDLYDGAEKQEPATRWEEQILSRQSLDAIEDCLLANGLDVMDSSETCPDYLADSQSFYAFWEAVEQGEDASQELIFIRTSGKLNYRLLVHQEESTYLYSMVYSPEGGEPDYSAHQIYDMVLTERGNFYYRVTQEDDPHYADYALIRLEAPDSELWALYNQYVLTGGYRATNIFLEDWDETDFSRLCFNDVWEYLYYYQTGEQFWPDGYTYEESRDCYQIPASEFEQAVLPFFSIDVQELRSLAGYDAETDSYPWRQVTSNDYAFYLSYYYIEPEVTACQTNADGTITLTVEALSTDLAMDCLFSHKLTVRPTEDGFQYVSNQMLSQTEYGLPYCQPRLTWEKA